MARLRPHRGVLLLRPGRGADLLGHKLMLGFAASSPLVSPSLGLMIWTLLLFGISMYALWKLAFPRIAQALDKRQRAIEESIDAADRTRQQADRLLEEYRGRLRESRHQAEQIIDRARQAAEVHEKNATADAKK